MRRETPRRGPCVLILFVNERPLTVLREQRQLDGAAQRHGEAPRPGFEWDGNGVSVAFLRKKMSLRPRFRRTTLPHLFSNSSAFICVHLRSSATGLFLQFSSILIGVHRRQKTQMESVTFLSKKMLNLELSRFKT